MGDLSWTGPGASGNPRASTPRRHGPRTATRPPGEQPSGVAPLRASLRGFDQNCDAVTAARGAFFQTRRSGPFTLFEIRHAPCRALSILPQIFLNALAGGGERKQDVSHMIRCRVRGTRRRTALHDNDADRGRRFLRAKATRNTSRGEGQACPDRSIRRPLRVAGSQQCRGLGTGRRQLEAAVHQLRNSGTRRRSQPEQRAGAPPARPDHGAEDGARRGVHPAQGQAERSGPPRGPFPDLDAVRSECGLSVSRFCQIIGIARSTYAQRRLTHANSTSARNFSTGDT